MTGKVEELAAKLVGTVKAAKATVEGYGGVFRHLIAEHGEASALLLRLKISSDPELRRELWQTIRAELLSHERAEMRVVYPALRRHADTQSMADEHDADAQELETAIGELTATSADSDQWAPALERVISLVQEHVRTEEEEYFPIADHAFSASEDKMLERFEQAKAEAKRQLTSSS